MSRRPSPRRHEPPARQEAGRALLPPDRGSVLPHHRKRKLGPWDAPGAIFEGSLYFSGRDALRGASRDVPRVEDVGDDARSTAQVGRGPAPASTAAASTAAGHRSGVLESRYPASDGPDPVPRDGGTEGRQREEEGPDS